MFSIQAVKKYADSIWKNREAVNSRLEELARTICPEAQGFASQLDEGQEGREDIWDSTPEEAAGMLAAALGSLLTNPATAWFSLDLDGVPEPGGELGEWLTEAARVMLDEMSSPLSGFYQEIDAFYMHLVSLAFAVLYIEYRDGQGLRFKALPPRECALAENADGLVDTLVRRFSMTAAQIKEEFGAESLTDAMASALEHDAQKSFTLTQLVCPRDSLPGQDADRPDGMDRAEGKDSQDGQAGLSAAHLWVSQVFESQSEKPLRVQGYRSFPFVVPRWSKRAGEIYGRGPGHAALPDIRVLNRVSMSQLDAAEKASNTPILAPDDSVLDRKINTYPGGVTWYRPAGGDFKPLPVTADLGTMQSIRQERQEAIRRLFLNDRIQLVGGPDMTATEVMARERKQMQALSPVLGRLQSEECLGRLVGRVFQLLWINGRLSDNLPEELSAGQELRVNYVSPIARAQKQGEAEAFSQALNYLAPLIELQPEILDHFDFDAVTRDSQEIIGYPQKYLKSEAAVKKLREARAKAQAEAAQMQMAMDAAKAGMNAQPMQEPEQPGLM